MIPVQVTRRYLGLLLVSSGLLAGGCTQHSRRQIVQIFTDSAPVVITTQGAPTVTANPGSGPENVPMTGTAQIIFDQVDDFFGNASGTYTSVWSGGGYSIITGDWPTEFPLQASTITVDRDEQNTAQAFVEISAYFEVTFPDGVRGYNQSPLVIGDTVDAVPPNFGSVNLGGQVPLFSRPAGGAPIGRSLLGLNAAFVDTVEFIGDGDGTSFFDPLNWDNDVPDGDEAAVIPAGFGVIVGSGVQATVRMLNVEGTLLQEDVPIAAEHVYVNGEFTLGSAFGASNPAVIADGFAVDDGGKLNIGTGSTVAAARIDGNFFSAEGSTFTVNVTSPIDRDELIVNGRAALGGTLDVVVEPQQGVEFTLGTEVRILSANEIVGRFDAALGLDISDTRRFEVVYRDQEVVLRVVGIVPGPPLTALNAAQRVNVDLPGDQDQPDGAVGPDGSFAIAFRDRQDNTIKVSWFDENGQPLFTPITATSTPGPVSDPAISYDGSLTAVAWKVAGTGVVGRTYSTPGAGASGVFSVIANPDAGRPDVEIFDGNVLTVAKEPVDPPADTQFQILTVVADRFGNINHSFFANDNVTSTPFATDPSALIVTGSNQAIITWGAEPGMAARSFDSTGTPLTPETGLTIEGPIELTSTGLLSGGKLAIVGEVPGSNPGASGAIKLAVIDENFDTILDEELQPPATPTSPIVNGDGGPSSTVVYRGCDGGIRAFDVLEDGYFDLTVTTLTDPGVVATDLHTDRGGDRELFTFSADDGDGLGTYYLFVDGFGAASGGEYVLTVNLPAGTEESDIDLDCNDNNDCIAGWVSDADGAGPADPRVVVCTDTADGLEDGCAAMEVDATAGAQTNPDVLIRDNGKAIITWDFSNDVFVQLLDENGGFTGSRIQVNTTPTDGDAMPQIVFDESSNEFIVSWTLDDAPYLVGRKFDADTGAAQTGEIDLGALNAIDSASYYIFVDGFGAGAWSEEDGGNYTLSIRVFDNELQGVTSPTTVTTSPNPRNCELECDEQKRCSLVYDADDGDGRGVFQVEFDGASGQVLRNETSLGTGAAGNSFSPSISVRGNGDRAYCDLADNGFVTVVRTFWLQRLKETTLSFNEPVNASFRPIGNSHAPDGAWGGDRIVQCWTQLFANVPASGITCRSYAPPPADSDDDTVPDTCDNCPDFDDLVDGDLDGVADGCDNCPDTAPGTPVMPDGCTGDLTAFGREHKRLGDAVLDAEAGGKVGVHNVGNSGSDGVTISLKDEDAETQAFTVQVALASTTLNPGAVLGVFAAGKIGTFSQLFGRLFLRNEGTGVLKVEASFSYLGVSTTRVQVFKDGQPVGDPVLVNSADIGTVPDSAGIAGFGALPLDMWGLRVFFDGDVPFTPAGGGGPLVGDEIRVVPEGFTGTLTEFVNFDIMGINTGPFSICDETLGDLTCPGYPSNTSSDGDDVPDGCDNCPYTVVGAEVDADGCPPLIPGDADGDGDVDDRDLEEYFACVALSGPAVLQPVSYCRNFDYTGDGCNAQDDFAIIQACYSGPGIPASVDCDPIQACCLPDNTCVELGAAACKALEGYAHGRATSCEFVVCRPGGACCHGNAGCSFNYCDYSYDCGCPGYLGTFQGYGTTCETVTCPGRDSPVICCLPGGECSDDQLSHAECEAFGGRSKGFARTGWDCSKVACPGP